MRGMSLTSEQRILRARMGGLSTAARGHVVTAPARLAFAARFYEGIPEDLPQHERDRRASAARRLYFTRLALKSSQVRGRKRTATTEGQSPVVARSEVRHRRADPTP